MQYQLGSCALEQIAVQLATPVLSVYPEKLTILIHGGAVHFSKEKVFHPIFGEIFGLSSHLIKQDGRQIEIQLPLTGISQEHGLIQANRQEMSLVQPGDRFLLYPVHSCLAANLADFYVTQNGGRIYHM
jgi:D-serine deaminase-like pyridoxal phosphate-dependent protein